MLVDFVVSLEKLLKRQVVPILLYGSSLYHFLKSNPTKQKIWLLYKLDLRQKSVLIKNWDCRCTVNYSIKKFFLYLSFISTYNPLLINIYTFYNTVNSHQQNCRHSSQSICSLLEMNKIIKVKTKKHRNSVSNRKDFLRGKIIGWYN